MSDLRIFFIFRGNLVLTEEQIVSLLKSENKENNAFEQCSDEFIFDEACEVGEAVQLERGLNEAQMQTVLTHLSNLMDKNETKDNTAVLLKAFWKESFENMVTLNHLFGVE